MSKEAMKLALEALQTLHDENMDYLTRNKLGGENNQCMVFAREAITALREALASEAKKPDFWEGYVPEPVKPRGEATLAQQEFVAFLDWYDNAHWGNEDFKAGCWRAWDAALAQRTWQGLTDEQMLAIVHYSQLDNARAIEAKLKEMNT